MDPNGWAGPGWSGVAGLPHRGDGVGVDQAGQVRDLGKDAIGHDGGVMRVADGHATEAAAPVREWAAGGSMSCRARKNFARSRAAWCWSRASGVTGDPLIHR